MTTFPFKLFKVIGEQNWWNEQGDAFYIEDSAKWMKKLDQSKIATKNFASVIRNFNNYGIKRVAIKKNKKGIEGWMASHPFMHRDHPENLEKVMTLKGIEAKIRNDQGSKFFSDMWLERHKNNKSSTDFRKESKRVVRNTVQYTICLCCRQKQEEYIDFEEFIM
jgi:hypothetical protein